MKVNKNSWLYKLATFGKDSWYEPKDLCSLVRGVFRGCFIGIILACAAAIIGVFLIEPYLVLGNYLLTGIWEGVVAENLAMAFLSTIIWCISLISFICVYVADIYQSIRKKKPVEKQPGIVRSYLKAKKEKYCPLIEYTKE